MKKSRKDLKRSGNISSKISITKKGYYKDALIYFKYETVWKCRIVWKVTFSLITVCILNLALFLLRSRSMICSYLQKKKM